MSRHHRISVLIFLLLSCRIARSQSGDRSHFEVAFGTSWDYGLKGVLQSPFRAYGKGTTSLWSIEGNMSFRFLKFLRLSPSYSWGLSTRAIKCENQNGKYIPQGYGLSLPLSASNPSTYYTEDYEYFQCDADVTCRRWGAYLGMELLKGFELGTGLFRRTVTTTVYTPNAYDEYSWIGTTGNLTDDYVFERTWYDGYYKDVFKSAQWKMPVYMQFKNYWKYYFAGMSVVWYPGQDGSWQFRCTSGFWF